MKETSKREPMDSLRKLAEFGPRLGAAIDSVVEDMDSRAVGPDVERAAITKAVLDTFNDNLQRIGLSLENAYFGWQSDQSPEELYDRLRGMRLISDERSLPNLFSA